MPCKYAVPNALNTLPPDRQEAVLARVVEVAAGGRWSLLLKQGGGMITQGP